MNEFNDSSSDLLRWKGFDGKAIQGQKSTLALFYISEK